jgi:DNA-binding MarR family transcriptional regulator
MKEEHFEQFRNLISGIHWNIEKLKSKWTAPLGMKSVHIFWVYLLKNHPEGLTAAELARLSQTNRSLVSREVQNLMNLGYVCAENERKNNYGLKLKLTPAGIEAAQTIAETSLKIQNQVSAGIPEADLLTLYRTLEILMENFQKIAEQPLEEQ